MYKIFAVALVATVTQAARLGHDHEIYGDKGRNDLGSFPTKGQAGILDDFSREEFVPEYNIDTGFKNLGYGWESRPATQNGRQ